MKIELEENNHKLFCLKLICSSLNNWQQVHITLVIVNCSLWKSKDKKFCVNRVKRVRFKKRLINELLHIATQKRSIGREFCAVFWGQSLICCHLVLQSQVDLWIEKKTTLLDSSSFHKSNYLLDPQDFPNKGAWMIFKKASNLPASYDLSRYRHAILKG